MIAQVRPADDDDSHVRLDDLLHRVGGRSFAPVILLPALILVSPLSAIPGSPSIGALIIVTVTLQALLGRRHLWLPAVVMRRKISARRLDRALDWLSKPARWIDGHTRARWRALTVAPLNRVSHLSILTITVPWPLLEPLPMVTSIGAFAVSLFGIGLMLRDGVYVLAGFAFMAVLGIGLGAFWQGLF
nr:exopolysaccharide biosynthesis protein [Cognatishimia sp. F0-27]